MLLHWFFPNTVSTTVVPNQGLRDHNCSQKKIKLRVGFFLNLTAFTQFDKGIDEPGAKYIFEVRVHVAIAKAHTVKVHLKVQL